MKTQELYYQLVVEGFKSELARHGEVYAESTLRRITRQALSLSLEAQRTWEKHEQEGIEEPEETQPSLNPISPQGSR